MRKKKVSDFDCAKVIGTPFELPGASGPAVTPPYDPP